MTDVRYHIFLIRDYECVWMQGDAVVAAESRDHALSLLKTYLETETTIGREIMARSSNIDFQVRDGRGRVDFTRFSAEITGVIYPIEK